MYTLISSLIIELIAILYLFLPREFCCEHYEHMAAPFSGFAATIFILLLYGVITYAERYSEISSDSVYLVQMLIKIIVLK